MSSKYVRDMIRGWAANCSTPYYDTINLDQNPSDPVWFTIEFEVETSDMTTFCGHGEEDGVFDLVFCGSAGSGDAAVIAAAEADAKVFLAQSDATGKLVVRRALPPEEFSSGDANNWYRVIVGLEYRYAT